MNKSWRQHPTRHQLYGQLPPITKTIQVRRTRHAGHCWRSKDELISDVLLWTPAYGRPAQTYIKQLCEDTGCSPEDLIGKSGKRRSGISVQAARHDDDDDLFPHTHTHTHIYIYIYIYIYILSSTDRLFRCITTLQCGYIRRTLEAQFYVWLSIRPLSQQAYHVS